MEGGKPNSAKPAGKAANTLLGEEMDISRKRPLETETDLASSKEKIIRVVREIHQSTMTTGQIDPKILEDGDAKFVFNGTEEELCKLIKEVVLEDEETRVYAEKTDTMLKGWAHALEREEGMFCETKMHQNW